MCTLLYLRYAAHYAQVTPDRRPPEKPVNNCLCMFTLCYSSLYSLALTQHVSQESEVVWYFRLFICRRYQRLCVAVPDRNRILFRRVGDISSYVIEYCALIGPILCRAARLPDPFPLVRNGRDVATRDYLPEGETLVHCTYDIFSNTQLDKCCGREDTYRPPQQVLYGQCARLCLFSDFSISIRKSIPSKCFHRKSTFGILHASYAFIIIVEVYENKITLPYIGDLLQY